MITIYYSRARERGLQKIEIPRPGCWIVAEEPSRDELDILTEYGLNRDLLDDALDIYEAPRVEINEGVTYLFARYCYPDRKEVATEPLLLAFTPDYLFTIGRIESKILDHLTHDRVEFVTTQKTKTVLQILNGINKSYEQQLTRVSKKILQERGKLRTSSLVRREFLGLIELEEDLNEFLSALQPQSLLFRSLLSGKYLRLYEEDRDMVEDIERSTGELIEQARNQLRTVSNMRQAYDVIATTNLNDTVKNLTSITIFLAIFTVIGGFWGMNVNVPFHDSVYGFPIVVGISMALVILALYIFRRKKWF